MRLFVSHARVDKPYCVQIVDVLDVHNVWYDRRLHAGMKWWEEIQKRIAWCDGFIYLLSPESIESEYCQKEFKIARDTGKHIFPVLIHPEVDLPEELKHIHYADLTKGLTTNTVKTLLNAIYIAERRQDDTHEHDDDILSTINRPLKPVVSGSSALQPSPIPVALPATSVDPVILMKKVGEALDERNYDLVVFLIKQAKENGCKIRFINLEAMLREAEAELERQAYLREAERLYRPIVAMVNDRVMRKQGAEAFRKFREKFPDYDPETIAPFCSTELLPMLEWCDIPAGEVMIQYAHRPVTYYVESFRISKYPITNSQYQLFVSAKDGYCLPKWWDFSAQARQWRNQNPLPKTPKFSWGDHPRANVSWYEATAFCNWLTHRTGMKIKLPTEQLWQRAAQGDDDRPYPWGNKYYKTRCNTRESQIRTTTPVTKYDKGASPFGVFDMAGNVWQWCDSTDYSKKLAKSKQTTKTSSESALHEPRAVRGGSFISVAQRVKSTFHFYLNPTYQYATIGFRVIAVDLPSQWDRDI
jgi:formylglycine-generating enzyme required for sulfatase activity